jgi:hypothetical protein
MMGSSEDLRRIIYGGIEMAQRDSPYIQRNLSTENIYF